MENKIDIDSRGAFVPVNGANIMWQYYETPVKDTALFLKAFAKDERDSEVLPNVMRWLLRSRSKDGAWGSTNNTLSVIDAFTEYLVWKQENESAFNLKITVNGEEKSSFDYNKQTILEQNKFITLLSGLEFEKLNAVSFAKQNANELDNNFYYDISLKYFLPIDQIHPRDEGFTISREFYALSDKDEKNPLAEARVGDVLKGRLKIILPRSRNFVAIEDFIPAGTELVNFNLETSDQSLLVEAEGEKDPDYWWRRWRRDRRLRPDVVEYRDDRIFIFQERLAEGEYEYDYYVRVLVPGTFHHLPAVVSEMYFPENFARTRGGYFKVIAD